MREGCKCLTKFYTLPGECVWHINGKWFLSLLLTFCILFCLSLVSWRTTLGSQCLLQFRQDILFLSDRVFCSHAFPKYHLCSEKEIVKSCAKKKRKWNNIGCLCKMCCALTNSGTQRHEVVSVPLTDKIWFQNEFVMSVCLSLRIQLSSCRQCQMKHKTTKWLPPCIYLADEPLVLRTSQKQQPRVWVNLAETEYLGCNIHNLVWHSSPKPFWKNSECLTQW